MVLVEQPDEIPQPEPEPEPEPSSPEPPPSVPGQNIVEMIMMKYGLKRQNHPPIVIAKPIPHSKSTSAAPPPPPVTPPSEPTSAPPPPVVSYSQSRKKHVAKKGTGTSEQTMSEQVVASVQAEVASETQSPSQESYAPH